MDEISASAFPVDTVEVAALADLSLPDLEDRLSSMAARIAASECEFLDLLAEFDAREGWGAWGCARRRTGCHGGSGCAWVWPGRRCGSPGRWAGCR